MDMRARSRPKHVQFSAVVIKKDGTKIDLGKIAEWHKNPFVRLLYRIKKLLGV